PGLRALGRGLRRPHSDRRTPRPPHPPRAHSVIPGRVVSVQGEPSATRTHHDRTGGDRVTGSHPCRVVGQLSTQSTECTKREERKKQRKKRENDYYDGYYPRRSTFR